MLLCPIAPPRSLRAGKGNCSFSRQQRPYTSRPAALQFCKAPRCLYSYGRLGSQAQHGPGHPVSQHNKLLLVIARFVQSSSGLLVGTQSVTKSPGPGSRPGAGSADSDRGVTCSNISIIMAVVTQACASARHCKSTYNCDTISSCAIIKERHLIQLHSGGLVIKTITKYVGQN